MLTQEQKVNLRKLASYLITIDPHSFSMDQYYKRGCGIFELGSLLYGDGFVKYECGTVACAVGHGPGAGIAPQRLDCSWARYSDRVFGATTMDDDMVHRWCFDQTWESCDNSPTGAAQRIIYMLEYGIPDDFENAIYAYRDVHVPLPPLEDEVAEAA